MLVGFNRGDADYAWEIPLKKGESVAQVFTASGDFDGVRIAEKSNAALVTVPACDAVVLAVSHRE